MVDGIECWNADSVHFREKLHAPLYNKLPISRSPEWVVAPKTEEDVVRLLRAARANQRRVAVRSGATSWIGASLRDGGVLIDMGAFDHISIDRARRTARVGAGVRSKDLAQALAQEGLAFPVGHCGSPAMGGYLLAGGLGLNWGHWQPACFSVRRIRVVAAQAEALVADEQSHGDLLWMARGAGPGFPGVVTEFELSLQPRPADVRLSTWAFPLAALDEVTAWVSAASQGLPSNVELAVTTVGPDRSELPPGRGVPTHLVSVAAIAYADSECEARRMLAPLSAQPAPGALAEVTLASVPFEMLHLGTEAAHPAGHRVLSDTFWRADDLGAVLTPLAGLLQRAPSGKNSVVALMPAHGKPHAGVPTDAGVYSMDARTLVLAFATWQDPLADAANARWMEELLPHLEHQAVGHFLGEADLAARPQRARGSFGSAQWERLATLRREWDPHGVFHGFVGA